MIEMTVTRNESNADHYELLAVDRTTRAGQIRSRAEAIPSGLIPLRQAMQRRAAELELSAAALREIAAGQRAVTAN